MPDALTTSEPTAPCVACQCPASTHLLQITRLHYYCQTPGCACTGYTTSLYCVTCGHPKWAGYRQCFGCLLTHEPPAEVVPKYIVGYDAQAVANAFRNFREQWELWYPGYCLTLDRERAWPELATPRVIRKRFYCQWRVTRRHAVQRSAALPGCFYCGSPHWRWQCPMPVLLKRQHIRLTMTVA